MSIGNISNVNLVVKDANQVSQNIRTNQFSDDALAGISILCDPVTGLGASIDAEGNQAVNCEGIKATYRWAVLDITPVATPQDVLIIQGSATKTVRIKKIGINGLATTAGQMPVQIIRRSAAGTAGSATLSAITPAKHDKNDPAATAVVSYVQTANYTTPGTSAGLLAVDRLFLNVATAAPQGVVQDLAKQQDKPWILRGVTDFIVVNLNGAAVPAGGALDLLVEGEEDDS